MDTSIIDLGDGRMDGRNELEVLEYRLLCRAVLEACHLRGHGDPFAGFRCLTAGFERAREYEEEGKPWAQEVEDEYLGALACYAELPNSTKLQSRGTATTRIRRVR